MRILGCIGLLLLAGCGFEWFPSNIPAQSQLSSATQSNNTSARKVIHFKTLSSIAPRQENLPAAK